MFILKETIFLYAFYYVSFKSCSFFCYVRIQFSTFQSYSGQSRALMYMYSNLNTKARKYNTLNNKILHNGHLYILICVLVSRPFLGCYRVSRYGDRKKDRSSKNESDEEAFAGSTRQCKLLSC